MISPGDLDMIRNIAIESKEFKNITKVDSLERMYGGGWGESHTYLDNVVQIDFDSRTEQNGGGQGNCLSPKFAIPLLKKGFVVINASPENIWIKKVTPVLRWDLSEDGYS